MKLLWIHQKEEILKQIFNGNFIQNIPRSNDIASSFITLRSKLKQWTKIPNSSNKKLFSYYIKRNEKIIMVDI